MLRGSNAFASSTYSFSFTIPLALLLLLKLTFEDIDKELIGGNLPPDSILSLIASKRLSFKPTLLTTLVIEGRNNTYSFPNGFSRAIKASTAYFRSIASSLSNILASGAIIALACCVEARCMRGKSLDNEANTARLT